jgi:NADH dehydrogenase
VDGLGPSYFGDIKGRSRLKQMSDVLVIERYAQTIFTFAHCRNKNSMNKRLQSEILNLCLRLETGALEVANNSVRIAIVGGGATGVELAAELREATEQLGRNGIDKLKIPQSVRITVIEGSDRLVAALPEEISANVLKELSTLDVDVRLNTRVSGVSEKMIELSDESFLDAEIIVWAAGKLQ